MKHLYCALVLTCLPALAAAQSYVSTQATGVVPTMFGSLSIADFDGDGDLDLLVTGSEAGEARRTARIYRNDGRMPDGTWSFTNVLATFPDVELYTAGLRASTTDVGDFDNDGDLDVLLTSAGGTVVYRNEGGYQFTAIRIREESATGFDSYFVDIVTAQSSTWGDYDNDGDLDILVAGRSGSAVYRNDGFARFAYVDVGLPHLPNGIVSWGDYDNDGDLDILAVSRPFREQAPTTRIFRNDGGVFSDTGAALPGIEAGSIKWGDYDNDGDLDVLIMSRLYTASAPGTATRPGIYRNDRGVFSAAGDTLPAAWYGDWVDFDGDGDLDIFLNGVEGSGTSAQLVRNDSGRFVYKTSIFPGVWFGDVASGDLDGDGGVELLMNGRHQTGLVRSNRFLLYRNTVAATSAPPAPPTSLASRRDGSKLVLSWRPPYPMIEDGQQYTYNLRVGTIPGGSDVLAPMSLESGKRVITEHGNAGQNQTIVLNGLRPDRAYYWSVQSIDHRQIGSAFASERVAQVAPVTPPVQEPVVTDNYPNPFNPTTTIRFTLPASMNVRVTVFNVLGAEIAVLANQHMEAGKHQAVWNATDAAGRPVPSGLYLYTIQTPETRITRSMLLLK